MMLIKKEGISYDMVAAATAAAMSLAGMGHAERIPTLHCGDSNFDSRLVSR